MLVEEIKKNKELKYFLKNTILKQSRVLKLEILHPYNKYSIHSLVGTSFDFMIRATGGNFSDTGIEYMKKFLNPEFNSEDINEIVEYNSLFNAASQQGIKKRELRNIFNEIIKHENLVQNYIKTPNPNSLFSNFPDPTQAPIQSFLYLAMVRHVFFKREFLLLNTMSRRTKELNDLKNLTTSINKFLELLPDGEIEYDKEFMSGRMLGGAESDLVINKDFIIDIKVVNQPILTTYMINQLVSYAALAALDGMKIKKVGIYFARHQHLETIQLKDLVPDISVVSNFLLEKYQTNEAHKKMSFNKPQKEFINLPNPILSIAGPGSGKTETLVEKVARQTKCGSVHDILLLTFTTKAANEMRARLEQKVGPITDASNIGTFHSVLFKLLKLKTYVDWDLILPSADMTLFVKAIKKICKVDPDEDVNKFVQNQFGARLYDLKNIPATAIFQCIWQQNRIVEFAGKKFGTEFADVVKYYLKEKKRIGVMNFDDILRYTLKTLIKNNDFRKQIQNRFKTIFVDEFQDTNFIQFNILKMIAKNNNVVAVGDPYQSIYGFMNARLENVITFNDEFNPSVVHMNINYRSTRNIVQLTNCITEYFKKRIEASGLKMKPLEAATEIKGEPIHLVSTNAREKATFNLIKQDIESGVSPNDIAVIIRKNRDSGKLERLLTKEGISFKKRTGSSFYERPEIQAVLNTFLFWINRMNYNAFRGFAKLFEGVGEETGGAIADLAEAQAKAITCQFVDAHENDLKYKRRDEVKEVLQSLEAFPVGDYHTFESILNKLKVVDKIVSGMKSADEAETAIENVEDILMELEHLLETKNTEKIEEELAVMLLSRSERDKYVDSLTITTAHSSKGLEWERVYIMDVSKHNFTECREDMFELEDEQIRLLYVAISRAKEKLILIHQNQLVTSKKIKPLDPIIEEIQNMNKELFKSSVMNY